MAHFAEIDQNNIVLRVLVVPNEQEHRGQDYLANEIGLGGTWKQTSYNAAGNPDKWFNYAGVGYTFDASRGPNGAFISPKPFPSWALNETNCLWEAPIPCPGDDHWWDENQQQWVLA